MSGTECRKERKTLRTLTFSLVLKYTEEYIGSTEFMLISQTKSPNCLLSIAKTT